MRKEMNEWEWTVLSLKNNCRKKTVYLALLSFGKLEKVNSRQLSKESQILVLGITLPGAKEMAILPYTYVYN